MSDIIAYTDGACSGNPGRGGYGLVIIDGDTEYRFSEGPFRKTTNNRMELKAFIKTLEFLSTKRNFESLSIIIRVDSKYVSDGITKWAYNWSKNNFSGRLNSDLWIQAWSLYNSFSKLKVEWVKGHHVDPLNQLADKLAVESIYSDSTEVIDHNYENT
jgi:ribonuclease HI